jgi:enoyl-[acyl-carrier protein] reductase/trans-2-enoyl-CoA reductase (NAD+)
MIIKPSIRSNIFTNAHPIGCQAYIQNLFKEAESLLSIHGPKNVLIIGGSSGYGLSSRVTLAVNGKANTVNVSFESRPKAERTGSAGWWNNIYFQSSASSLGTTHKDFVMDAFSKATKEAVIAYAKQNGMRFDLVIYSLASGARTHPETGELIRSSLKSIDQPTSGNTIDIGELSIKELTVQPATEQEIADTVFVMGGSDWKDWIHALDEAQVLSQHAKTISYTYVGSKSNAAIYRDGTIGRAKDDLEKTALALNAFLKEKYEGEGLISVSKAVVTKASVFIPRIPFYVSAMFEVMKAKGTHETILAHKNRLFSEMVYGDKRLADEKGRLRIDAYEMDDATQLAIQNLSQQYQGTSIFSLEGTQQFIDEFYQINGFRIPGVNYEEDVDLSTLSLLEPQ